MARFELLNDNHKELIEYFRCSDEPGVEAFLKKDAYEFQYHNCGTTQLCFNDLGEFVGYFSLFNDTVYIGRRKLDKHKWDYPKGLKYFPALKIHYLGVDDRFRKKGYGKEMLFEIFDIALDMNEYSGCAFLTLEAKEKSIGFYKHHEFDFHSKEEFQNMMFNIKKLR